MATMTCKGACRPFKVVHGGTHAGSPYAKGLAKCQTCNVPSEYMKGMEGARCTCCGTSLRRKSRQYGMRRRYQPARTVRASHPLLSPPAAGTNRIVAKIAA